MRIRLRIRIPNTVCQSCRPTLTGQCIEFCQDMNFLPSLSRLIDPDQIIHRIQSITEIIQIEILPYPVMILILLSCIPKKQSPYFRTNVFFMLSSQWCTGSCRPRPRSSTRRPSWSSTMAADPRQAALSREMENISRRGPTVGDFRFCHCSHREVDAGHHGCRSTRAQTPLSHLY